MTTNLKSIENFLQISPKSVLLISTIFIGTGFEGVYGQNPNSNSGIIYSVNGMTIQNYDPSLPLSASNPINNTISLPPGASGLAVCDGISSGPGPGTRFYTTLAGNYYYWDGNNWVNTGHSTGDASAANIGGGSNYIFNLVGATGEVYRYDGNGNSVLVATLPSFAGGGPFDMVVDNNGNFYMLQTAIPQSLKVYNPNGTEICSYNLTNMPNLWAGGGYAIIDNKLYVNNGAFYTGTFSGSEIVFASSSSPLNNPTDFASSPFDFTNSIQASISSTGTLGCTSTNVNISVTTNIGSANFSWTGPGMSATTTNGNTSVTLPGMYSCTVTPTTGIGCPAVTSVSVASVGLGIIPNASVLQPLTCLTPTTQLSVAPVPAMHTYTWTGAGIVSGVNSQNAIVNTAGMYSVLVRNTLTGCVGTETVVLDAASNPLNLTTSDVTVCHGSPATMVINGNADSYTWDNGSSVATTLTSTVTVNPIACTSYTVTGTLGVCTSSVVSNIIVNSLPVVSVLPCSATICTGLSGANFTASGADSYVWMNPAGLNTTTGSVVNANPNASSVYTVIGTSNTCTNSATFTVTTSSNLALTVSPLTTTICNGGSANITASGASLYQLDNTNNTTGIFTASPNTTTTYTLTGINGGCTGSEIVTVNVVQSPVVSITSSTTSVCEGESVNLFTSGASNYVWATNNTLSCSITGAVVANPVTSTVYTVTGTIGSGATSCTDTQTINITVLPKTNGHVIDNQVICVGSSVDLYATGGNDFEWFPAKGLNSTSEGAPTASPESTTIYTVQITRFGQCMDTKTVSVTVNPLPLVSAGNDTTILFGDYVELKGEGEGTLKWTAGQYLTCNQCSKAYVAPLNSTCYVLEATNQYGCKNTDARCIEVQREFDFFIPNSFTPNGDGLNDVFNVVGTGILQFEMHIYDRWGNLVFQSTDMAMGWDGKQHGLPCKAGTYVCKVKATDINDKSQIKYENITLFATNENN